MESYFLSDIHLKSINERNGQTLLRFLHSLEEKSPVKIFFLGDIFDLWVSGHDIFKRKYKDLLTVLESLKKSGCEIYFFEGNHDLHIHPYWRDVLGAEVYVDAKTFDLDGLKVRCEHGDLINLNDKSYLRLRNLLRHPWVEKIGHRVPGEFWLNIGDIWSPISRKKSGKYRSVNKTKLIQMIREHAHRAYSESPFDLIISGHMHVRDDFEFQINAKTVRSINLGSWFEDVKVLKIKNEKIEWLDLN